MTINTISTLPTAPARTDAPATFISRADAFLGALVTMQGELNTSIGQMNTDIGGIAANVTAAEAAQTAAELAETNAEAAQAAAEAASNATLWVSGTSYSSGDVVYSPVDYKSYRANTETSGTTDPSASADWTKLAYALPSQSGNAGFYLTTDGTNESWGEVAGGGGFTSMQVITSTGTWTKPDGISKIRVTVIGGGGGGCGTTGNGWISSGAAGGTAIKIIDVSAIASESVTIGAGGAGGTAGGGTGGAGGTTSFGAHCSSTGGAGGSSYTDGALGGIGSSGDLNIRGGYGNIGANNTARPGPHGGGFSYLGPGGRPTTYANRTGNAGDAYGSGGGAGSYQSIDQVGGAGAAGVVIVEEFV